MKPKESQIQTAIINYLRYKGFYCQRMNSGSIRTATGGMVKLAAKGTPDLMAFRSTIHTNIYCDRETIELFFIECKIPGKKATPAQAMMMQELESFGAKCIVAHSLEEIQQAGL